jgi:type I restriction enzyme S subunit
VIAPRVKAGLLAEQLRGVSYKKEDASDSQRLGYLPILRAGNITDAGLVFSDLVFVPKERVLEKQLIKKGDVVIAASSGSIEVVGKAAQAKGNFNGSFGAFCKVLRPNAKVYHDYFAHFFKTLDYRRRVSALAAGANINNLRNEHLDNLQIPLPPLAEQKRIAEVLDKAEELRSKRRAALAQLDSLTQSIFLEMFGDPVRNPKKWPRLKLVDVCSSPEDIKCGPFGTQLSCSEFREEGVPLWGIKNVNKHFELPTHEFLDARTAQRLIQYSIQSGDIVMTRKGTVGNCSVYPLDFPLGIMHSDLLRLRVDRETCDPIFLSHQLHYSRDVAGQLALISGGAVMPGINVTKLKSLEVLVPGIVLQREFAHRVAAVEKIKATQRASLAELDTLFASLQHSAFSNK